MAKPKLNDYVVTLCEKGGRGVMAIRADGFQSKTDVLTSCWEQYPEWNVKNVGRLYEEDFADMT